MTQIFDEDTRAVFAQNYPETPHRLRHNLRDHPLLTLDALAQLGESLPATSVEYNKGDLPTGVDPNSDIANGLSIGDTIRTVDVCRSWAVLKNIEQVPEYRTLLLDLLDELKPIIESRTGAMLMPQGFIFVSSPDAVTPYHFDPEHNILLQLKGSKTMTQFPAGDPAYAPDETHEAYHTGGHRNLVWHEELARGATDWRLEPGQAVFVPVMAPHHVKVGRSFDFAVDHMAQRLELCRGGRACIQQRVTQVGPAPARSRTLPGSEQGQSLCLAGHPKAAPRWLEPLAEAQFEYPALRIKETALIAQRCIAIAVAHLDIIVEHILDAERNTAAFEEGNLLGQIAALVEADEQEAVEAELVTEEKIAAARKAGAVGARRPAIATLKAQTHALVEHAAIE